MELLNHLKLPEIEGAFAAMITPFGEDGKLNDAVVRDMLAFFKEKQLDGVFTVSNIGEFPAMTLEKKLRLIELCCSEGSGSIAVCPGITDFDYSNSILLAKHAKKNGAAAVVLSAPIYYPYSVQYVESFISGILDESPLPVIFYHSPKFAQPVSFSFLLDILSRPKVAAVKESSGDAILMLNLLEERHKRGIETPIMLGFEELTLTGMVHGANGCITSCCGIVPELMQGIIHSYQSGNLELASAMQKSVCRITAEIKKYGFPLGYKLAMKARGFDFRIIKSGMDNLEAEYNSKIPEFENLIRHQLEIHNMEW